MSQYAFDSSYNEALQKLEQLDESFNVLVDEYTKLYDCYQRKQLDATHNCSNVGLGSNPSIIDMKDELVTKTNSMGAILNEMKQIAYTIWFQGKNNQNMSVDVANALVTQSMLLDVRKRQYNAARNEIAQLKGLQKETNMDATKYRRVYFIYILVAAVLIFCFVYVFMGGSLPFALVGVLILICVYIGWEYYKGWLVRTANYAKGANIEGVGFGSAFRMIT